MEETNNTVTLEKILYSLNDFSSAMLKSVNCLREDMNSMKNELKRDIKDLRDELREFKEETNKRWEENNRRWDENDKRWDANDKKWEKYEENRVKDRDTILGILLNSDISISEQLGDPNVEKNAKNCIKKHSKKYTKTK